MAVLEATLLLGTLLRQYRLTLVNPRAVKYGITVTLPIAGGLPVQATPRVASA
jgi:cytochrome P450